MKFIIERGPLLKALAHVQSVVERRNTIPILSNVLIDARDDRLTLTATDLDIQIIDVVSASIETPGATTVGAHTLLDIIRKMPEGSQVEIVVDAGRMRITAGRSRFQLPVLPAEDFPQIVRGELDYHIPVSTTTLRDVLVRTRYAISTEETRYYLNGIYMHLSGASMQAVATDGHRLARTSVQTGETPLQGMPDVIVPRKTIAELSKIVSEYDGNVEIYLSRTKVAFEIGSISLLSKAIDGTFPDYTRVIPQNNSISVKVDNKSLSAAVDRVTTIASEKTRSVKVSITKEALTVSVTSPENGTAIEEVPCEADGEVEIGFNSRYLLDVLANVAADNVELRLADSTSPALVLDAAHSKDAAVLMPIRI